MRAILSSKAASIDPVPSLPLINALHPQLSPQPLHHARCTQALKHGCASRSQTGLRHGLVRYRGTATQACASRSTWHRGTPSVAVPGHTLTGAGTAAATTWIRANGVAVPEIPAATNVALRFVSCFVSATQRARLLFPTLPKVNAEGRFVRRLVRRLVRRPVQMPKESLLTGPAAATSASSVETKNGEP